VMLWDERPDLLPHVAEAVLAVDRIGFAALGPSLVT